LPTSRELQLLALLEEGLGNEQVADRLSLSVPTVKWHLHNLYVKLGVRSRSAALARARTLQLIAPRSAA
jgi:LuxR family transcriptional regulator, maltose regulon positive regulatory protein